MNKTASAKQAPPAYFSLNIRRKYRGKRNHILRQSAAFLFAYSIALQTLAVGVLPAGREYHSRQSNGSAVSERVRKGFFGLTNGVSAFFAGTAAATDESLEPPTELTATAFGPKKFTRTNGAPNNYIETFTLPTTCTNGIYRLVIKNGEEDGTYRISSADIKLNGIPLFTENEFNQNVYYLEKPVTLAEDNILEIRLISVPQSYLTIDVRGENCGPADTVPPSISITSPADNHATTDANITISGTAEDPGDNASGIAQVLVNDQTAAYDPETRIWEMAAIQLSPGSNVITAKAIDHAGNESTTQVTIIRDLTSPEVVITSPSDGSVILSESIQIQGHVHDGGNDASGISRVTVNGTEAVVDLMLGTWSLADFSLAIGTNTLTAIAFDRAGNQSAHEISVTRAVNQPPAVNAGPDQTIDLPNLAHLNGSATDDGYPVGSVLSISWSKISGNGEVVFSNADSLGTTVQFSQAGVYTFRLTVSDGQLSASDDVTVTVNPANEAPVVDAGADQAITLPFSVTLSGMVSDDGNPVGSNLAVQWSKVSGDGDVLFSEPANPVSLASFSDPGTYILRLSATDGLLSASDTLTIIVNTENQSPTVDAGLDQVINLPNPANLNGSAADDGLPQGSSLVVVWSKVSGPGEVSFSNTSSLTSTASFTEIGNYVLRLTATDGDLASSDDVIIAVGPPNQAPIVNAGEDKIVALPTGAFQFVRNDVTLFNQIASTPPIVVDFDSIPAGTDITGNSYNGILFELGNQPAPSAPLIVVRGIDTFTPGGFAGVINAETNKLIATSGENVLSPGGLELAPGLNNLKENDDLRITFAEPVAAVGLDILFQSYDFFSAVAITIYDPQGSVLYQNSNLPVSTTAGGGAPGGTEFFGFVSRRSNIKTILINELDNNNQNPDSNIGFDTIRVQKVLPNTSVTLNGVVSDDGLPVGGNLTSIWTKVSGPGTATFTDVTSPSSAVSFSQPGTYVLRLSADDSELTSFDEVVITAYVDGQQPTNQPPQVDAGVDQTITLFDTAYLFGIVTDDGMPAGSSVAVVWSMVSGPGTVSFSSPTATSTEASFTEPGIYILRLTATDTVESAYDEITIAVLEGTVTNESPVVHAGDDRTVTLKANLVSNPSAEIDLIDGQIPNWLTVSGTWSRSQGNTNNVPTARFGNYVFSSNDTHTGEIRQDIDLRAYTEGINAGSQAFEWRAYVRSLPEAIPDSGRIIVEYRDVTNQHTIATLTSGDIASTDSWHLTEDIRVPPVGTGFIRIRLLAVPNTGSTSDVFFDGLSLKAVGNFAALKLNGVATDDGLPTGSLLQTIWTKVSGSGEVIFGNATHADSSVKFTQPGVNILRLTATDGLLSSSDELTVTINPANIPPSVEAGMNQTITLPAIAQLDGTATDDSNNLRYRWEKVSGPGVVTFSDIVSLSPTATFSLAGSYVLRLSAEDGELESSDEITITVNPAAVNHPPTVDAGENQTIQLPQNVVNLTGIVSDDGLPNNSLSINWTKRAGTGNVTFADPGAAITTATFDIAGSYILRLTVTDGQYVAWDEIAIVVNPEIGGGEPNQPPTVVVGPDQTIGISETAILEAVSITDDGLPVDGHYSASWSKVSGPGNVTFSNPTQTATYATFSLVGTYIIRLTVSDSELSGSDDLTISVLPDQPAPIVEILTPADGHTITEPTAFTGNISGGSWKLEYSLADNSNASGRIWTEVAYGTGPVSGILGTIDTTAMLNGLYEVRVTATNQSGQSTSTITSVSVENDLKIGNFTISFEDMNVPMAGIPIQIIRTYDSRDKRPGDFGVGWTLGFRNIRVEKNLVLGLRWYQTRSNTFIPTYCVDATRPHIVTVTMPDGKVEKFEAQLDRRCQQAAPITQARLVFSPAPGTQGKLAVTGDNTVYVAGSVPGPVDLIAFDSTGIFDRADFKYTSKEGTEFVIDLGTGLRSVRDTNGNTLTITANGVTHSSGKSISFTRDFLGRITEITDPNGISNAYGYDENGDLVTYTDGESNTTAFTYEPTIPHHLRSIVDPLGRTPIRNEYDASGRLIKHIDVNGNEIVYTHDLAARVETVTDRLGNSTVYEYDGRGNVLLKRDATGNETTYSYDSNDNLLTETNVLGKTTTYTYDIFDNRTSITDPLNNRTEFTYNTQGKVLTVRDARGYVTTNTYDTAGNLLTTTDSGGNVAVNTYSIQDGSLTSTKDALNNLTRYESLNGYLIKETDAQGNETSFGYDANGNRTSQTVRRTNAQGQTETITTGFEYDDLNRLTKTIFADGTFTRTEYNQLGQQAATIDQAGNRTEFEYDTLGRLIRTTFADGRFEGSTYDAEGRRLTSTDRAGHTTAYKYDTLGRLKKTTYADGTFTLTNYDAAGQVLSSVDARGNATAYSYDDAGRRLTVTNALGQLTSFTYDANGNQVSVTDARNNAIGYVYDDMNRRTRVNFADASFTETTYDALGRRIAERDQAGKITQFVYDSLGRLTKVIDALGQETIYAYNELGQQILQRDALGKDTRYEYDTLGRRTKRILPLGHSEAYSYDTLGNLSAKTDFNGKTTSFAYDNVRRLMSKTPDASLNEPAVTFTYNDLGQRATMTDASGVTTYGYDIRNRLSSKQTPFGTLSYTYDGSGNIETLRSSNTNGVSVDYSYDEMNRLEAVRDNRLTGLHTTGYTYDSVGNLQSYTYPNQVTTSYAYNSLNRLTAMTVNNGQTNLASYSYTLGAAGNRTQVTELSGRTVNYAYDDLYRLTSETIANSANSGQIGYQYDAVGNRLQRGSTVASVPNQASTYDINDRLDSDSYDDNGNTRVSSGRTFNYDFENKLTSTGDGITIVYDGDGNRVSKTVNGQTTSYLVDTNNLTGYAQVVEEIVSGQVAKQYTYGHDLISQRQASNGNAVSFYQYDGHGSVRQLTDSNQTVTDTYTYDAFGILIERIGQTDNNYLYAGEQFDPDLGFYYNRARYLNISTGRFVSQDTYEGNARDSLSLHKYLYAHSNPISLIDPSGHFSISQQTVAVVVHNILSSIAVSAPIRASEAILAYSQGVDLGTAIQDAALGIAGDAAIGAVLGGAFSQLPRILQVRSIAMGIDAFRNSRLATSVWRLAPFPRGIEIEKKILGRVANISSEVPNFPVIDDFSRGVATSIKSIDLTADSYQSASALLSRLSSYADDLSSFKGANWGSVRIADDQITNRVLVVGIENGAATAEQVSVLKAFQKTAERQWDNIRVLIKPVE